jgi:hypothetical protein
MEDFEVICHIEPCCNFNNNLRLIVAAPNLLWCGEEALNYYKSLPEETVPQELIETYKEIITKAEGDTGE